MNRNFWSKNWGEIRQKYHKNINRIRRRYAPPQKKWNTTPSWDAAAFNDGIFLGKIKNKSRSIKFVESDQICTYGRQGRRTTTKLAVRTAAQNVCMFLWWFDAYFCYKYIIYDVFP